MSTYMHESVMFLSVFDEDKKSGKMGSISKCHLGRHLIVVREFAVKLTNGSDYWKPVQNLYAVEKFDYKHSPIQQHLHFFVQLRINK